MFSFKKDWMLEYRIGFWIFIIAQLLFFIATVLVTTQDSLNSFILQIDRYTILYQISLAFFMSFPLYALISICPKVGSRGDARVMTNQLPFTKKRLYWKGLKPWLIACPIYITLGTLLYTTSQVYFLNRSMQDVVYEVWVTLVFCGLVVGAIILQIISGIIISLAKNIRWYKMLGRIVISNIICFIVWIVLVNGLQIDTNEIAIAWSFAICFGGSLVIFIKSLNQIEHIYQ